MPCCKNECKCRPHCQSQTVTVYTLDRRHIKIQMSYSETVESLKQHIASVYQSEENKTWPPERMKLWVGGYYLENDRTLSDYDLTEEDEIIIQLQ